MNAKAIVAVVVVLAVAASVLVVLTMRGGAPGAATGPAATQPATRPARLGTADVDAIFNAVRADDVETVRALLAEQPALANARGEGGGETPLHRAKSVAVAQLLLDAGADLNAPAGEGGAPPVRWAARNVRPDVIRLLLQRGATQDDVFFHVAAGDVEALRAAIDRDPAVLTKRTPPGDVFNENSTLLHVATWCGQTEVCRLLLDRGMDVNVKGGWGNTVPLEHAAYQGFAETVQLLIDRGVNIEDRDNVQNHTALWWAAITGRREVVRVLLEAKATIEPTLPDAVRNTMSQPYPGRDLPPREDYEAVLDLLREFAPGAG